MANLRYPTWIELHQSEMATNVQSIQGLLQPKTRLMAVVKANAYGHGLQEISDFLQDKTEVQWLGVARLNEAVTLRKRGINLQILVLGYTPRPEWSTAAKLDVSLAIHEKSQIKELIAFGASRQGSCNLRVHLKVDTGMHRLGMLPTDVLKAMHDLASLPGGVVLEGLFSHFHSADAGVESLDRSQLRAFKKLVEELEIHGLRPPLCHCANTAAILRWPEAHFDMVRLGGGLYGLNPDSASCRLPEPMKPVLQWKTQVAQVRHLEVGMGLGYRHSFQASRPSVIAVLPVGYGDGLRWASPGQRKVLLGGGQATLVGRISMDQSFADVTDLGENGVRVGDPATLIGNYQGTCLWADAVAGQEGTIEYEVTTRLAERIPRLLS